MPPPDLPRHSHWSPLIAANSVFSAAECDAVLALRREMKEGGIADSGGHKAYRSSRVCWLRPGPDTEWVFARAWDCVQRVNAQCYKMDLAGFTEPLQISEYAAGQYYDWHLDLGNDGFSIRKLSFVVQLSDPTDYEGGGLETLHSREPSAAPRARGTMVIFPSYILHRVAAVTRGARRSLVGWIGGPHYR